MDPFPDARGFDIKQLLIVAGGKTRVFTKTPDYKLAMFQRELETAQALRLSIPRDTVVSVFVCSATDPVLEKVTKPGPIRIQGPGEPNE